MRKLHVFHAAERVPILVNGDLVTNGIHKNNGEVLKFTAISVKWGEMASSHTCGFGGGVKNGL